MAAAELTIRFEDPETQELLEEMAERFDVSVERLAEELLAREVRLAALAEPAGLEQLLDRLRRRQRPEELEADIAAFARAEVEFPDPAEGRRVFGPAGGSTHSALAPFLS